MLEEALFVLSCKPDVFTEEQEGFFDFVELQMQMAYYFIILQFFMKLEQVFSYNQDDSASCNVFYNI